MWKFYIYVLYILVLFVLKKVCTHLLLFKETNVHKTFKNPTYLKISMYWRDLLDIPFPQVTEQPVQSLHSVTWQPDLEYTCTLYTLQVTEQPVQSLHSVTWQPDLEYKCTLYTLKVKEQPVQSLHSVTWQPDLKYTCTLYNGSQNIPSSDPLSVTWQQT